jgi:hypothetical protein
MVISMGRTPAITHEASYEIARYALAILTLCRSYLNPYCLGRKTAFFFSGHLNLQAKPETGIPYREKNNNNKSKKDRMIILSDFIRQTTESYSFIHTTQYIYEENTSTF